MHTLTAGAVGDDARGWPRVDNGSTWSCFLTSVAFALPFSWENTLLRLPVGVLLPGVVLDAGPVADDRASRRQHGLAAWLGLRRVRAVHCGQRPPGASRDRRRLRLAGSRPTAIARACAADQSSSWRSPCSVPATRCRRRRSRITTSPGSEPRLTFSTALGRSLAWPWIGRRRMRGARPGCRWLLVAAAALRRRLQTTGARAVHDRRRRLGRSSRRRPRLRPRSRRPMPRHALHGLPEPRISGRTRWHSTACLRPLPPVDDPAAAPWRRSPHGCSFRLAGVNGLVQPMPSPTSTSADLCTMPHTETSAIRDDRRPRRLVGKAPMHAAAVSRPTRLSSCCSRIRLSDGSCPPRFVRRLDRSVTGSIPEPFVPDGV